jgi:hypothetical protein
MMISNEQGYLDIKIVHYGFFADPVTEHGVTLQLGR